MVLGLTERRLRQNNGVGRAGLEHDVAAEVQREQFVIGDVRCRNGHAGQLFLRLAHLVELGDEVADLALLDDRDLDARELAAHLRHEGLISGALILGLAEGTACLAGKVIEFDLLGLGCTSAIDALAVNLRGLLAGEVHPVGAAQLRQVHGAGCRGDLHNRLVRGVCSESQNGNGRNNQRDGQQQRKYMFHLFHFLFSFQIGWILCREVRYASPLTTSKSSDNSVIRYCASGDFTASPIAAP